MVLTVSLEAVPALRNVGSSGSSSWSAVLASLMCLCWFESRLSRDSAALPCGEPRDTTEPFTVRRTGTRIAALHIQYIIKVTAKPFRRPSQQKKMTPIYVPR